MRILCVLVLYKQKLYDSVSYNKVVKTPDFSGDMGLFIYDNSPSPMHSSKEFEGLNYYYVSDVCNPGVSKAYNEGAKYAKQNGFDWVLLLDQDTDFQDNQFINNCVKYVEVNPNVVVFVPKVLFNDNIILSPLPTRHHIAYQRELQSDMIHPLKKVSIINSGTLIRTDIFIKSGGYNERVPLDFSDHQFFERIRSVVEGFYLMNYTLYQSFSNNVDDISALKTRFKFFCIGARNYQANYSSKLDIAFVVFKRWISLTLRTMSFDFTKIMFNNYITK